jgi:hypothetical protein
MGIAVFLRKCRHCGLEAKSQDELSLFRKGSRSKYGHDNCCIKCGSKVYNDARSHAAKIDAPILQSIAKRSRLRTTLAQNPCWIYVITNNSYKGWCKIGRTIKKNIKDRLVQYNTYSPTNDFHLVYSEFVEDARIEGDIIDAMKISGILKKGEWFQCELETMLYHIKNYTKIIEDFKKQISLKQCKPVVQLNLDGSFVAEYESMTVAAQASGVHLGSLGYVCKTGARKLHQTGGYMWKLKEDYDKDKPDVLAQRLAWREEVRQLEAE